MSLEKRTTVRAGAVLAVAALLLTACSDGGEGSSSPENGGEAAAYPADDVTLIVPAAPGGGWDLTARTMQQVISDAELTDRSIEVVNREGGGGATGLADLINNSEGDPNTLMIGGLVMIGALAQANSPLSLSDVTTVATLTSEPEAFVVRADSPYETIEDVVNAYSEDPNSVIFGGGSQGGSDHIVVGLLLDAAGEDPSAMNYIGYAGGGEATAGILSGDVAVGVSGVSEFVGQIESGDMRLLGISVDDEVDVAGEPAPTLASAGYDVDFANWRGIFAPAELSDEQLEGIVDFVTAVHDTEEWQSALERNGWRDDFRTGQEAQDFIDSEIESITGVLEDLGL